MLQTVVVPPSGYVLDLAGGNGAKIPLIRAAVGDQASFIVLDANTTALREAQSHATVLQADAHALPFRNQSFALVACIASLGLFANKASALGEARRVLKQDGCLLVVSAEQGWVEYTDYPPEVHAALVQAYRMAQAAGCRFLATPDITDATHTFLQQAHLHVETTQACLLDGHGCWHDELPLIPWNMLEPLVAPYLDQETLRCCARSPVEIELHSVAIALIATPTGV